MKLELTLLIPTFNEAGIIADALRAIAVALGDELKRATEVLIVDDGTDELPQVVAALGGNPGFARLEVLRNNPRLGKGRSLALGFERARGPIVGFLDVDLSTPPRYILSALDAIRSGRADGFIGSRYSKGSIVKRKQSPLKTALGDAYRWIARAAFFSGARGYRDPQCGFKFFRNRDARFLYRGLMAGDGLADLEVLIRANMRNLRVEELGVEWTDLRESKRELRRILVGEVTSLARIFLHYRLCPGAQRKKLEDQAKGG